MGQLTKLRQPEESINENCKVVEKLRVAVRVSVVAIMVPEERSLQTGVV
jgi:hypothetical protein